MKELKKYAVVIVREETRVVWAAGRESAQDTALELDGAQIRDENEETTRVDVFEALDDAEALNTPDDVGDPYEDVCACGQTYTDGDADEDRCGKCRNKAEVTR